MQLHSKNASNILKRYGNKLRVVEEKSVILYDKILSSHINKDGLHLNSCGTIKLVKNLISRNQGIRCFDVTKFPIKDSNASTALLP